MLVSGKLVIVSTQHILATAETILDTTAQLSAFDHSNMPSRQDSVNTCRVLTILTPAFEIAVGHGHAAASAAVSSGTSPAVKHPSFHRLHYEKDIDRVPEGDR